MNAAQTRSCERCGGEFIPKRSDARFCSDACRAAANRTRTVRRSDNAPAAADNRTPSAAAAAAGWEPPSEPPHASRTGERCPGCGEPLYATPRRTRRACLACRGRVIPAGVAAPYERGTGAVRQVRSQRERDLEAIALARRKGVMLGQLEQLAAAGRLHPESRPVVGWFADEVKAAATGARLDELAGLLPDAGIRRHWWQPDPAALEAAAGDEDQGGQDGYGGENGYASENEGHTRAMAQVARSSWTSDRLDRNGPMTWEDALNRLGWRLIPLADGCQVSDGGPACGAEVTASIGEGWACYRHRETLAALITRSQR